MYRTSKLNELLMMKIQTMITLQAIILCLIRQPLGYLTLPKLKKYTKQYTIQKKRHFEISLPNVWF